MRLCVFPSEGNARAEEVLLVLTKFADDLRESVEFGSGTARFCSQFLCRSLGVERMKDSVLFCPCWAPPRLSVHCTLFLINVFLSLSGARELADPGPILTVLTQ